MDFNYHAVNTFTSIHSDPNKYLFVRGPVGSGKSSGCIWHIILNSWKQWPQYDGVRRSRYGVLRASYPALKSTVIKSWQNWFKNMINIVYDTPIRGEIKMPHPDGQTSVEIELVFLALDREEDVNKLQSLELTGAHCNEAAEIPRGVHQMLKSRVNRFPDPSDGMAVEPFIICDYNSVDTEHWLYKIAEEEKPPKHSFYHQPPALLKVDRELADLSSPIIDADNNYYIVNPEADNLGHYVISPVQPLPNAIWNEQIKQWWIPHLSPDYYVDQVYGAGADWVNVMILNNYGQVRTGRPVYSDYQDSYHATEKPITPLKGVPIIIGMDLGLTPAAAFMQLTPMGQLLVFDELVTEDCSIQTFCHDILKPHMMNHYSKFNYSLIIDPAATQRSQNDAKTAAQIIKECGLHYKTAKTNNEMKRRESVVYFLKRLNGFQLSSKCTYLRKGFISEYKYEKKRLSIAQASAGEEAYKEKPFKNIYSHIHDALQYGALQLSEGRTIKRRPRSSVPQQPMIGDSRAGY